MKSYVAWTLNNQESDNWVRGMDMDMYPKYTVRHSPKKNVQYVKFFLYYA